jgi:formylmethanofuran dehydrogenase subunit C
MTVTELTLVHAPTVPLEAEVLVPDVLASLDRGAMLDLPVQHGRQRRRLGEFFDVAGDGSEVVVVRGDLRRVKGIGTGMTRGRLVVEGSVGMHLGARMSGGEIVVHGDAGDWLGAEMRGGSIRVRGSAGGQIGGAYRGSQVGMRGGVIVVEGDAGIELGMRMRAGMIAVAGRVGDFAGLQMRGGTIVLLGPVGARAGAWMRRGTLVAFQPVDLLPTFAYDCTYRPVFLRPYLRALATLGLRLPHGALEGLYRHFTGDAAEGGRGEILQWQAVRV